MTLQIIKLALELLLVSVGALCVLALSYVAFWLSEVIPLSPSRRRSLRRLRAPLGVLWIGGYALLAVAHVAMTQSSAVALVVVALMVAGAVSAFGAFRDLFAGLVLKTGGSCQVRDTIQTQGVVGRIARLGLRTLTLVSSDGDQLVVPYSRVTSDLLWLRGSRGSFSPYTFVLPLKNTQEPSALHDTVRRLVLLHHWASSSRSPETRLVEAGLEVTVFTLDARRGPEIERSVRAGVAKLHGT